MDELSLDPMSQAEVEARIRWVSRELVRVTEVVADLTMEAAEAEHAWKLKRAQVHFSEKESEPRRTVADLDAVVTMAVQREHFDHLMADAKLKAAMENGRNLRSVLDSLRSVNANVRAVVEHEFKG